MFGHTCRHMPRKQKSTQLHAAPLWLLRGNKCVVHLHLHLHLHLRIHVRVSLINRSDTSIKIIECDLSSNLSHEFHIKFKYCWSFWRRECKNCTFGYCIWLSHFNTESTFRNNTSSVIPETEPMRLKRWALNDPGAWRLNCGHACAFGRVDEAVSGGKPPAGKGVVGLLSWQTFEYVLHFVRCVTVRVSLNQIIINNNINDNLVWWHCHRDAPYKM